jgi:hypothetical protein
MDNEDDIEISYSEFGEMMNNAIEYYVQTIEDSYGSMRELERTRDNVERLLENYNIRFFKKSDGSVFYTKSKKGRMGFIGYS